MKTGKLGKLKMPPKDAIDMGELEMDLGEEASEEAPEGEDMAMGMGEEEPEASKGGDLLTKVADEDLLAEVKKRGLTAQLGEEEEQESESESDEYM